MSTQSTSRPSHVLHASLQPPLLSDQLSLDTEAMDYQQPLAKRPRHSCDEGRSQPVSVVELQNEFFHVREYLTKVERAWLHREETSRFHLQAETARAEEQSQMSLLLSNTLNLVQRELVEETRRREVAEDVQNRLQAEDARAKDTIKRLTDENSRLLNELGRLRGEGLDRMELRDLNVLQQELEQSLLRLKHYKDKRQDERRLCVVCMEQDRCVLLMDCKHLALCADCCENLRDCPQCRAPITAKVKVFNT